MKIVQMVIDIPEAWEKCNTKFIKDCIRNGEPYEERKKSGWNVITKCPMDADEIADWCERLGYEIPPDEAFMYGNLPDEGEDVLVCTMSGTIFIDSLCWDEGCYFEDYGEMDGIVAWRPLPEPYREVDE